MVGLRAARSRMAGKLWHRSAPLGVEIRSTPAGPSDGFACRRGKEIRRQTIRRIVELWRYPSDRAATTRRAADAMIGSNRRPYVDADYNACLHVIATAEPRGNPAPRAVGWEWRSARSLWRPPSPPNTGNGCRLVACTSTAGAPIGVLRSVERRRPIIIVSTTQQHSKRSRDFCPSGR